MKWFSAIATILLVLAGSFIFHDRQYYFVCLAIIIAMLVPFVFSVEKISLRHLVLLGALAALAAVSRVAFAAVEQFKPITAIVILSGVCMGAQSGFIVGATAIFASNMYFSQGPWTPWQMLAMGLVGFVSGLLFGEKRPHIVLLAIYGFMVTAVLYGVIMDLSTAVMTYDKPTLAQIATTLSLGAVFNVIHGASSFVFILLIGKPLIKKLDRLIVKYGL